MKQRRTAALIGAIVLTAGVVASCSAVYSQTDIQDQLSQAIHDQTGDNVNVICPTDVTIANGGTFTCTATAVDDTGGTVTVTFTDDNGGYSWELNGG
jgi:hypothetical protein